MPYSELVLIKFSVAKKIAVVFLLLVILSLLCGLCFAQCPPPPQEPVSYSVQTPVTKDLSEALNISENDIVDLEQVLKITVRDNLQLKMKKEKVVQAEAYVSQLRSTKGIKVRAEGQSVVQGPPIKMDLAFPPVPPSTTPSTMSVILTDTYNTKGRLVVEKVITTFGKIENQIASAISLLKAEDENYETEKSNIIFEAKKLYFNILKTKSILEVAKKYRVLSTEYRDLAVKHHEHGVVSSYDVIRANLIVEEADKNVIMAEKGLELLKSSLLVLMNVKDDFSYDVKDLHPRIPEDKITLNDLKQLAIANRYELKSMQDNMEAAKAMHRAVSSLNNPDLVFAGEYDYQTLGITFMPHYSWSYGLGIRIPIFDGGERSSKMKATESAVREVVTANESLNNYIGLEVKKAWLDVKEAIAVVKVSITEVKKSRQGYVLARERYIYGVSLAVEMDEALVSYNHSQNNLVNSIYDLNIAMSFLEKAVGTKISTIPLELPDEDINKAIEGAKNREENRK